MDAAECYDDMTMPGAMVMKAAGISRSALVNYERHGAVRPARDENDYRVYSRDDLLDVMCCTMLTSMGYSVAEAADILRDDDVMSVGHIDGYLERLTVQRDVAQAKIDNLTALRAAVVQARPPETAPLELVECPDWLFFFDEHESVDIREVKVDNQVALMRSMPLACRGFMMGGFLDDAGSRAFRWARTLRCDHARLLDVDMSRACVFGGPCVRTALRAAYPDLDPRDALRLRIQAFMLAEGLRPAGDPFVPLLPSNRRPSPVFEVFVPVKAEGCSA